MSDLSEAARAAGIRAKVRAAFSGPAAPPAPAPLRDALSDAYDALQHALALYARARVQRLCGTA